MAYRIQGFGRSDTASQNDDAAKQPSPRTVGGGRGSRDVPRKIHTQRIQVGVQDLYIFIYAYANVYMYMQYVYIYICMCIYIYILPPNAILK